MLMNKPCYNDIHVFQNIITCVYPFFYDKLMETGVIGLHSPIALCHVAGEYSTELDHVTTRALLMEDMTATVSHGKQCIAMTKHVRVKYKFIFSRLFNGENR